MDIEKKVVETIEKYALISEGDKVVVALSGGKDSTSVLYILKKLGYDVSGLLIDLKLGEWSEIHNRNMRAFCEELGVLLTIVDLKDELGQGICFIKAVLKKQKGLTGCSVCGTVKRWILNKWAKKLGGDKLVTGHNLDDEAQNVLMNFLKGNLRLGIRAGPKTGFRGFGVSGVRDELAAGFVQRVKSSSECQSLSVSEFESGEVAGFVQRVKPLFFVAESEIGKYALAKKFDILYDRCPCAFGTYRVETRGWMGCVSDEEKLKIVEGWQAKIGDFRGVSGFRGFGVSGELKVCGECGEPSSSELCSFCKIMESV